MMFSRRVASVVWLLALVLATLPGCRRSDAAGAPAAVRLGYFANLSHAQAVLGVSSGDFGRALAPSKVETTVFNAGPSLVEALFAGQIDLGYVGPGPAIGAHGKSGGRGIRVVAGAAANGVVLVVRKDSGVATLADLAGKKIATPQLGNTQDLSARHYVTAELKQKNTDTIVPIANAEQAAMFARGEIDAAWVPEPWGERLIRETGARLLAEEKDLWPQKEFLLTAVVTTPEFLAAHPDLVKKSLEVHVAWTDRLAREPDKHVAALGAALEGLTGKRLPEGVLAQAIKRVKFTDALLPETFQSYARWSHDLGFDRGAAVDPSGLFDTKLLTEVRAGSAQ